jgi:toxin ParE1/3/4
MVVWAEPAKADLHSIHNFIVQNSKYYARKVVEDIIERSLLLEKNPKLGRIVPEYDDPRVREIIIYSYRLIYEMVSDTDCVVLTIAHSKQNLAP